MLNVFWWQDLTAKWACGNLPLHMGPKGRLYRRESGRWLLSVQRSEQARSVHRVADARVTGTLKGFGNSKGCGFISRESGPGVLVNDSAIQGLGFRSLEESQRVEFSIGEMAKGPQTTSVVLL